MYIFQNLDNKSFYIKIYKKVFNLFNSKELIKKNIL